jgi:short-subunit dehydrogenase
MDDNTVTITIAHGLRGAGRILNTASVAGFEPGPGCQLFRYERTYCIYEYQRS